MTKVEYEVLPCGSGDCNGGFLRETINGTFSWQRHFQDLKDASLVKDLLDKQEYGKG